MRILYTPNSSHEWQDLLVFGTQRGGAFVGYRGNPYQRGAGLGSFFRGLFKAAVPLIKRAAKAVGKQALKTGVGVLGDVARGGEFLPSLELHGKEAVSSLADKAKAYLESGQDAQVGGGTRRKLQARKRLAKQKSRKKKRRKLSGARQKKGRRKCIKGNKRRGSKPRKSVDIF